MPGLVQCQVCGRWWPGNGGQAVCRICQVEKAAVDPLAAFRQVTESLEHVLGVLQDLEMRVEGLEGAVARLAAAGGSR